MSDDGSTSSDERDLNCSAEEGSEQGGTDGFANVLNKILSQDIGNKVQYTLDPPANLGLKHQCPFVK